LPDIVRLTPIMRRLRADLERLVREAQEPFPPPRGAAENKGASPSVRAALVEQPAGEMDVPHPETAIAEPTPADPYPAETQEACPICLQPAAELSSYRGKPMCGNCVTLLRGY
jgi:hypothetical protein